MFLPPEQRPPGPPPGDGRPRPRRPLSRREESVLTWLAGVVVVVMFVAPIGGGTVLQAVAYLLRRSG